MTLELANLATLDGSQVDEVTDLKLSGCDAACVAQLPESLEKLTLWSSDVPHPLRLDHLPRLKSVTINPRGRGTSVEIEALPACLEKLDLWSCVVDGLPDPLPLLNELRFDSCDVRAVRWDRLPTSLKSVTVVRCVLPAPLRLSALPVLESAMFYACNLEDARALLALPKLEHVSLGLCPLDETSLAALKARVKSGASNNDKPAQFELTRQLYAMGVNLSAEKNGTAKIRLHYPLMSVAEAFPREDVMALAAQKPVLSGQAFIDELHRRKYAAVAAAKAIKKAAREAAKKAKKGDQS